MLNASFPGHISLFRLLLKPCSIIAGHTLDLDLAVALHTRHAISSILTVTFFAEVIVCLSSLTLESLHIYYPFPSELKKTLELLICRTRHANYFPEFPIISPVRGNKSRRSDLLVNICLPVKGFLF